MDLAQLGGRVGWEGLIPEGWKDKERKRKGRENKSKGKRDTKD